MGSLEMILLDTHTWIWFVSNPELLSNTAKKRINRSQKEHSIYISCISAWEVALLVEKKRLELSMEIDDWISKSEVLPFFTFVPIDNDTALRSVRLQPPLHNDPADRIIIATALKMDATIITKDEKILNYPHVRAVW